jgi:hypothetical protein
VQLISFLALAVAYQAFPMLRILGTFLSHVDSTWRILGYQTLDALKAGSLADHRDGSGLYSRFGHKLSRDVPTQLNTLIYRWGFHRFHYVRLLFIKVFKIKEDDRRIRRHPFIPGPNLSLDSSVVLWISV